MSAVTYSELTYERPTSVYEYPDWGVGIGWALAVSSAVLIPVYAVYTIVSTVLVQKQVRVRSLIVRDRYNLNESSA